MSYTVRTHGEMRREIARIIGSDPERYSQKLGNERHKPLLADEVAKIAQELGVDVRPTRQETLGAIMVYLGRPDRGDVGILDSADLELLLDRLR